MRLEGKVALITGAAHGMGAEDARLFAREGAKVAIADIREEDARKVEAEIAEAGGDSDYVHLDVTRKEQWIAPIRTAVSTFVKLDVLVNNAGSAFRSTVEETTMDECQEQMDVHAKVTLLGAKHAIPKMRKTGGRSIVNISSIYGGLSDQWVARQRGPRP